MRGLVVPPSIDSAGGRIRRRADPAAAGTATGERKGEEAGAEGRE